MGKSKNITKEQEEQIIYNYTILKMGQKKAGAFIPVSDKIVKRILIKNNIPIKTIQETNVNKMFVNHNYFKIQSHDMAYWIGILGSDGSVNRSENQIYIELQRSDKKLLEKLNNTIENARPIKDYETARGYQNSKLYFYSKEIKQDLAKYKIIPNKTYDSNYGFPFMLNREYYPDYIRGLFDGDGSIKKGSSITWQLDSGSLEIITTIQSYFKELGIDTEYTILSKKNIDIYRLYAYGKNKIIKIYNVLYGSNSNLFLERKKQKFQELLFNDNGSQEATTS